MPVKASEVSGVPEIQVVPRKLYFRPERRLRSGLFCWKEGDSNGKTAYGISFEMQGSHFRCDSTGGRQINYSKGD